MALALCHTVPRDRAIRGVFFLLLVSFLLFIVALLDSRNYGRGIQWASLFDRRTGTSFLVLRGWDIRPSTSPAQTNETSAGPTWCPVPQELTAGSNASSALVQAIASLRSSCTAYSTLSNASWALFLAAPCTMFLLWLVLSCCGVMFKIAGTNTGIYCVTVMAISLPVALGIAALVLFDTAMRREAVNVGHAVIAFFVAVSSSSVTPSANTSTSAMPALNLNAIDVDIRIDAGFALFAAASAVLFLAFILAVVRLAVFRREAAALKDAVRQDEVTHHQHHPKRQMMSGGAAQAASEGSGPPFAGSPNAGAPPAITVGEGGPPGAAAAVAAAVGSAASPTSLLDNPFENTQHLSRCHQFRVDERLDLQIKNDDWRRQQIVWNQRRAAVKEAFAKLEQSGAASSVMRMSFVGINNGGGGANGDTASGSSVRASPQPTLSPRTTSVPLQQPLTVGSPDKASSSSSPAEPAAAAASNSTGPNQAAAAAGASTAAETTTKHHAVESSKSTNDEEASSSKATAAVQQQQAA